MHERISSASKTATTELPDDNIIDSDDEVSERISHLTLPSNATSIRSDITDSFSCEGRVYGYYADMDNDCQIFHVCLPVAYPDGKKQQFRWSFICPEETMFNQVRYFSNYFYFSIISFCS